MASSPQRASKAAAGGLARWQEALAPHEAEALLAAAKAGRPGLVVICATTVLCAVLAVALFASAKPDAFLLSVTTFCAIAGAIVAVGMWRHLRSLRGAITAGTKQVHRTQVERISWGGGATAPRVSLTLKRLGTLTYRGVPGLQLPSADTLHTGMAVQVHLTNDASVFLRLVPDGAKVAGPR